MSHYSEQYERAAAGHKARWEPYPEDFPHDWDEYCRQVANNIHTEEEAEQWDEPQWVKVIKKGKDKEGKIEGARYCFLDCWPLLYGWEGTQLHHFAIDFVELMHADEPATLEDISNLIIYIDNFYVRDEEFIGDVMQVRQHALTSGKYSPGSYKGQIDIEDLYDAVARHYIKYIVGEREDQESCINHLAHMAANLLIIAAQIERDA